MAFSLATVQSVIDRFCYLWACGKTAQNGRSVVRQAVHLMSGVGETGKITDSLESLEAHLQ